jgi:hypothetical protein
MRKSRFLAGLAALSVLAVGVPAQAQTSPVDVLLENPGGTRVVHVENVDGTPLEELDFGTSRSLPFKIRVVDNAFDREDFQVTATMTNLYRTDANGNVSYALDHIDSADISLGSVASPSALDVKALVQPVLDTVTTITNPTICNVLGFTPLNLTDGCTINGTAVTGKLTELTLPQDVLNQLPKLPLVPQAVTTGPFTNPEYGAGSLGAGDPAKTNVAPTARQVLGGSASPVDLSALQALVDGLTASALIDPVALLAELGQTLPISSLLPTQVTELLASTTVLVEDLELSNIISQTGTYVSLPTLKVNSTGAEAGDYKGTLVVTALQ